MTGWAGSSKVFPWPFVCASVDEEDGRLVVGGLCCRDAVQGAVQLVGTCRPARLFLQRRPQELALYIMGQVCCDCTVRSAVSLRGQVPGRK